MNTKLLGAMTVGVSTLLASTAAEALDAAVSLSHSAEYTTNTTLADSDEIDEWINTPAIDLLLSQTGAMFEVSADYRVEHRIYEKSLFDDETAVRGSSEAIWHALPERLDLTARNTRTESTIRARDPNTETNRQTVSNTEVGPTLRLRPQSNAELQLEYLYADVTVDETDTDSERHTGTARYILDLSATRTVTIEASNRDVDFDNPIAPDLDIWVGSVTLANEGSNLQYSLTGGYNQTERTQNRDDVSGAIFSGNLTWVASPTTSVELQASREIGDQSSSLRAGGGGFGDEVDEETDLNEVFTETRGSVILNQRLGNNDLILTAQASEEDYDDIARDSERVTLRLQAFRSLNPRTSLRASIEGTNREFTNDGAEYDEIRGSVELARRLGRRFEVSLSAWYEERDSDDIVTSNYDEWIGRLTLTYNLLGPTTAGGAVN